MTETNTGTYVTFPLVLSSISNISKHTFCTSPQIAVRPTHKLYEKEADIMSC